MIKNFIIASLSFISFIWALFFYVWFSFAITNNGLITTCVLLSCMPLIFIHMHYIFYRIDLLTGAKKSEMIIDFSDILKKK